MTTAAAPSSIDSPRRWVRTAQGFLMVLRQGDDVFAQLARLTLAEDVPSASVVGLGFGHATFGFWRTAEQRFQPKRFDNVEIGSLAGSLAWKAGQPSIHLHAAAGDETFAAYAGHLLALEVAAGSMEITITVHPHRLVRMTDACTGANVLDLGAG